MRPSPDSLVEEIERCGVSDRRLIAAFRSVDRARYVPPELMDQAYQDRPLPIPHGQVTTQQSLS